MTILGQIVDQITEALDLPQGTKIAALIDGERIAGWTKVYVYEDGTIDPIPREPTFSSLKTLFNFYGRK
jgi:hypothetical protein